MKKLTRLKKLHHLIKLQEQDILIAFKGTQKVSTDLKNQIEDLSQHNQTSAAKLMRQSVTMNEVNNVRSFNGKVEQVIDQLKLKLDKNDEKLLHVVEQMKEVKSRMKSIERLTQRETQQQDYVRQKHSQLQIDENINYKLGTNNSQE